EVAASHPVITTVRGPGLFIGVELDHESTGRSDIGKAVANDLRRRGVLVGATGPRVNVIKIGPRSSSPKDTPTGSRRHSMRRSQPSNCDDRANDRYGGRSHLGSPGLPD
ncbi:MAG: hypothetical protein LH654_10030, partial [Thermoleophilia bacterium]|nr:hypothetical protein [Thermoleophilia bacterium]